jgi:hypothetical protein
VIAFKKMMGMATKRDKIGAKPDVVEEIEPEKVESVTPDSADVEDIDRATVG